MFMRNYRAMRFCKYTRLTSEALLNAFMLIGGNIAPYDGACCAIYQ